ncbi:MAG: polyprenyl synthetase family protein [Bacillota bacterium]
MAEQVAPGAAFAARMKTMAAEVDRALDAYLPRADEPPRRLHEAMRYGALAPGKRIRPFVLLATAEALGLKASAAMPAACALECIHAYSLIHDDLPAMDDDDFRRGRPSCHKAFDEATAILAGDALLTLAFDLMARVQPGLVAPEAAMAASAELGAAAGSRGMVGGQALELEWPKPDDKALETIHRRKTGALFRTAAAMGAHLAGAGAELAVRLGDFGETFGLAYQIVDDLQDAAQDAGRGTGVLALTVAPDAAERAAAVIDHARRRLRDLTSGGDRFTALDDMLDWLRALL